MEIRFCKEDILSALSFTNFKDQFDKAISFNDLIILRKDPLTISFGLTAVDGELELNIIGAKALGSGFFGVIRKKAGDLIISMAAPYSPRIQVRKHTNGNIRIKIPGINFTKYSLTAGEISIDFDFN